MGAPPTLDPNRTIMGNAPSLNMTVTVKPVQCPVCKAFNPPGLIYCGDCGLIFELALQGDAFGAPAVQLPCLIDSQGREHKIRPGIMVLGRQGDLQVEDTRASRRHAQIEATEVEIWVEDLGSTNGTSVNGSRVSAGEKRLVKSGDKISLGGYELTLSMPGEVNKTLAAIGGKTAALNAPPTTGEIIAWVDLPSGEKPLRIGEHVFGRREGCDLVIPDPYVSGRHGLFTVTPEGLSVTDTGSTNGTVVNDSAIPPHVPTPLGPDDVVKLGVIELKFRFKQ
jgi:pSer/pThr/pTyr-binding forkhead associated (FHA) protein